MLIVHGSPLAQVAQPFDGKKFNFNKALQKEVLFQFEPSSEAGFDASAPVTESPNLVFINVSPIEYGHVLLVPRVLDCLPQVRPADPLRLLHMTPVRGGFECECLRPSRRAAPRRAVPCRAVPCRAVPCRAVPCSNLYGVDKRLFAV